MRHGNSNKSELPIAHVSGLPAGVFGGGSDDVSVKTSNTDAVTLFLSGDVMLGRAIDQVLPWSNDPVLYEPYVRDARDYIELAERAHGPIRQPVDCAYIWGDALAELDRAAPDLRLINLETAITTSDDYWPGKGIHYRLHPRNVTCLNTAGIDVVSLANNHVLDWGYAGLGETLHSLDTAGVKHAGAGANEREAGAPAILDVAGKGRVIVFSFGSPSSGISRTWAALTDRPGVNLLPEMSRGTIARIRRDVQAAKRHGGIAVASIHWGGNWGYTIPAEQTGFAHRLIDEAGVDVIHGHSSHHPMGIEVYREKLIIYGSGDLLNDYEGIGGYVEYRADLALMYFAKLAPATGRLLDLRMQPSRIEHLCINSAGRPDAQWLCDRLNREGGKFGTRVLLQVDNSLVLQWNRGDSAKPVFD